MTPVKLYYSWFRGLKGATSRINQSSMAVRVVVHFWYITLSRMYDNHGKITSTNIYTTQKITFIQTKFVFTFQKDHSDNKLVYKFKTHRRSMNNSNVKTNFYS